MGNKLRYDLIDPQFLRMLALVFTYGRDKYPNQGLDEVPYESNLESLQRHTNDLAAGYHTNYEDWGLPMEVHIAARAMMAWISRTRGTSR